MLRLRCIYVFLLTLPLLLVLTACGENGFTDDLLRCEITTEDIVGIWRAKDQDGDWAILDQGERFVALYITDDGNLFVHTTEDTSICFLTFTWHLHYEIVGNRLMTTPIIWRNDRLHDVPNRVHTLHRYKNKVPFGWTDIDRQIMLETTEWVQGEIFAFAERFGEALNIPVLPYDGFAPTDAFIEYQHVFPFTIEDIIIEIAFIGNPPTPTRPQSRHVWSGNPFRDPPKRIENANSQFALLYNEWGANIPLAEWIDTFAALED